MSWHSLNLPELPVFVLTIFIKFNKAPKKSYEAFTKPYHGLIEDLLKNDLRYYNKWLYNTKDLKILIYI